MTSTAPPTVSTPEEFIKSFPNTELTKLSKTNPSKAEIIRLKSELLENLATIYCTLPSGRCSWMAIIQTDAEFQAFHQQQWVEPTFPVYPVHGQWIPQHQVDQDLRQYNVSLRQFMEFNNIKDAVRNQILAAVDESLIASLKEVIMRFSRRTPRELIQHLERKYNKLTTTDIRQNDLAMKEPFDPTTEIELLFQRVEDCAALVADISPYSPRQILDCTYELLYDTGIFHEPCETWDRKPDVDKTWDNFKTFFFEEQTRLNRRTAQNAGYANGAINGFDFNEATEAFTNLANATVVDRESMLAQSKTIESLMSQLAVANTNLAALTAQFATLKTDIGRGGAISDNGGRGGGNPDNGGRGGGGERNNRDRGRKVSQYPDKNLDAAGNVIKKADRDLWGTRGKCRGGYCWTHGYRVHPDEHTSAKCNNQADGHQEAATVTNTLGGSVFGKPT